MDKGGSEGDEILIFACREIGCEVPANITNIGQLNTELFIQIISKALAAISNDEVKVIVFKSELICNFSNLSSPFKGSGQAASKHRRSSSYLHRYRQEN
jgi:hypothetical protein